MKSRIGVGDNWGLAKGVRDHADQRTSSVNPVQRGRIPTNGAKAGHSGNVVVAAPLAD